MVEGNVRLELHHLRRRARGDRASQHVYGGRVARIRQCADADGRSEFCRVCCGSRWTTSMRRRRWRTARRCCRRCTATRRATRATARRAGITTRAICFTDRLTEIYFWSMDRKDLERVPMRGFVGFLEGKGSRLSGAGAAGRPGASCAEKCATCEADITTPDTRLADYLHGFQSGRDTRVDESHDGRLSAGGISGLCTAGSGTSIRCDAARVCRKMWARWWRSSRPMRATLVLVNVDPVEAAYGGRAGRRLWRAPVRFRRGEREDADDLPDLC